MGTLKFKTDPCAECWPNDQCRYCGCCQHTKPTEHCKVNDAPTGMRCPEWDCGCEGQS